MAEESLAPAGAVSLARPGSLLRHLGYVLVSMRPRQWTKNAVVFMALIFSVNQEWQIRRPWTWDELLLRAAITFGVFCLVSGADYLVNDARDRESDRLHPRKSRRPIAAGLLRPAAAYGWAGALWAVGSAIAFAVDWRTGLVVLGYIATMLAYSFVLKHQVILDVMAIAAGFVLRAMAGAYAIDVPISPWLYVVTALGALFLAITKRRAEAMLLEDEATLHRQTLALYTPALLDQMTSMVTASTVIAYGLYTFTAPNLPANHGMMLTIPFVVYGVFRYLYLSLTRNEGGNPEDVLFKDIPLVLSIVSWVASSMIILSAYR